MNKNQATNLFAAVISFLGVILMLFFAATASKNAIVFLIAAVFWALVGAIWVYRFAKARRTL